MSCRKQTYIFRAMSVQAGADITTAILGIGSYRNGPAYSVRTAANKEAGAATDTNVSCGEMDGVSARGGRPRLMVDVGTKPGEIVLFHMNI